jgi:hypothetical protein
VSIEWLDMPPGTTFKVYVWGVTIGDGTIDDLLVASPDGKENLQPVSLYFPHPDGEALDMTLTTTDAAQDDVWGTDSSGNPDFTTPVLGSVNGTDVSSYSFSVAPNDPMGKSFLVGDVTGSTVYDVLGFTMAGEDDSDDSAGVYKAEEAAGDFADTGCSAPSNNNASNGQVTIIAKTGKNGNDLQGSDVTGQIRDWLVGVKVILQVGWTGPQIDSTISWHVPGDVLSHIRERDQNARSVVHLARYLQTMPTVSFFWVSTPGTSVAPDVEAVTLSVGSFAPVSTFFRLQEPDWETSVSSGTPGWALDPQGWEVAMNGINWTANVSVPAAFPQGEFKFVQTVTPRRLEIRTNGDLYNLPHAGELVLDTSDPYAAMYGPLIGGPWTTGASHSSGDDPGDFLDHQIQLDDSVCDRFQTYLMFRPDGDRSEWVPLAREDWSWGFRIDHPTGSGTWTFYVAPWKEVAPNFVPETNEPVWDANIQPLGIVGVKKVKVGHI